jgi:ribonuclease P protein component
MHKHTFKRGERLKSRKEIGFLFGGKAESFAQYPLRLIWRATETPRSDAPVQFALSVPKKKFKKASARNVLRRRVREAYRQSKHYLLERLPPDGPQYAWMVLYTGVEALPYADIEKAMRGIIRRFLKQISSAQ